MARWPETASHRTGPATRFGEVCRTARGLADAAVFLMREYDSPEIVNVGTGEDLTIRELGELVRGVTGFEGAIRFDATKPDGTPRKLLDVRRLRELGWQARIPLVRGIRETYAWYVGNGAEQSASARVNA